MKSLTVLIASGLALANTGGLGKTQTPSLPSPTLMSMTSLLTTVTGGDPPINFLVKLSGPAPVRGAVVLVTSRNMQVATIDFGRKVAAITIPAGQNQAVFKVMTHALSSKTSVTIAATYGGATKNVALTVLPPALWLMEMSPQSVTGGTPTTGQAFLTGRVASGASAVITLASNNPAASVPPTLTIPADTSWNPATFQIATNPVPTSTVVAISASYAGVTKTTTLTILPLVIISLTCDPTSIIGGSPISGTVKLSGKAPAGGAMIALSSSNSAVAAVPQSEGVNVSGGTNSASFQVTTVPVTSTTLVDITASYGGKSIKAMITVYSPPCTGLFRLTVSPSAFNSIPSTGATVTATVNLGDLGPAPPGGAVVKIIQEAHPPATGGPTAGQLPASVVVPQGKCTVTLTFKVFPCTVDYASCTNEFTAEYLGRKSSATVVLPLAH